MQINLAQTFPLNRASFQMELLLDAGDESGIEIPIVLYREDGVTEVGIFDNEGNQIWTIPFDQLFEALGAAGEAFWV